VRSGECGVESGWGVGEGGGVGCWGGEGGVEWGVEGTGCGVKGVEGYGGGVNGVGWKGMAPSTRSPNALYPHSRNDCAPRACKMHRLHRCTECSQRRRSCKYRCQ
jgi:hypothetical protein